MTDQPSIPAEVHENLARLAKQGKKINQRQRWILLTCYENWYSIQELADMAGVHYNTIYDEIVKLKAMNLIEDDYQAGKTHYWKVHFDISQTADYTYTFRVRNQNLSFENTLFYLYSSELTQLSRSVVQALCYLYYKDHRRVNSLPTAGPSGAEVKSFVNSLCDQINEYTDRIRALAETKLFEQSEGCHELFGPMETDFMVDLVTRLGETLPEYWKNKHISVKGRKLAAPREQADTGRAEYNAFYGTKWKIEGEE